MGENKENKKPIIVKDGIIDKSAFENANKKICFLLKQQTEGHYSECNNNLYSACPEAFTWKESDELKNCEKRETCKKYEKCINNPLSIDCNLWDLCTTTNYLIKNKTSRYEHLYPELNQWAHILLDKGGAELWYKEELEKKRPAEDHHNDDLSCLQQVAIINISKEPSKIGKTEDRELKAVVNKNKAALLNQIIGIQPKLVICCGTYELAKTIFDISMDGDDGLLKSGNHYFDIEDETGNKVRVVEFIHISARISKQAKYAFCKELARALAEEN